MRDVIDRPGLHLGRLDTALVSAHDLTRDFRVGTQTVHALRGVSVWVAPGDRIALLGSSGSGKSTLLHLLGALDAPTSGTLSWPALGAPDTLRPGRVSFVFQAQSLLAPLSAVENVALPLILNGQDQGSALHEAQEWLERLDLGALADQLPEELSGGQAQRVAVARALVTRPRLILADEPTGQLDSATAQQLMDVLLAALEPGSALVLATHDPAVATRLKDVWHLQGGAVSGITRSVRGLT
ncbi:putative ABC transport system ATP-binding protein/lipoprotein-releasing system ATP-binding protein [Deinococcus metalli]|uniref:ABC transporter ATP-binding protein n=1 Tax=Deinococcus metalli TaxID=1141878 RepID=A0A7W8KIN9_9DEIO|nr:ABC transporter ATP-binding protein [Deinococcus metalli]MBB5378463.1 putative ABC transport system ATP-binding protein/lipoprotein-releasing system ATP-binding protein [Deinococcus metalli]GHF57901.1 ABC transporter ATP-binding protein [Deinococcus metalli]